MPTASQTSDAFLQTHSEEQQRRALIQRRNPQDFSGPPLPAGSTTESPSRYSDHSESHRVLPPLDEDANPIGHIGSGADVASAPSATSTSRGKERAVSPYPPSTQPSGTSRALQSTAPTRRTTPLLAEHQTVMARLPETLTRSYRSLISRFLCHLEQQGLS